ncbi:glycosyltransferase [Bradyrhizobium sp. AS23.2]|uniref:glycosyltransferase n=1 Tax=Bradyrhizobium sp. AS23.2 TaxID=1680155 RepID=UPI001FDA7A9B|nr:glycosyltransferase [Bradyrhizobium sp. AS23.2]
MSLLAEAFVQRGHQVSVVCLQNKQNRTVDVVKGVRVYRVPLDNDYWPFGNDRKPSSVQRLKWHLQDTWNRKSAARFAEILDIEKPDVIHTNNLTGFSVSLWSEAKRRNIRIVHTLRDYSLLCKRSTLFRGGCNMREALHRLRGHDVTLFAGLAHGRCGGLEQPVRARPAHQAELFPRHRQPPRHLQHRRSELRGAVTGFELG